MKKSMKDEEQKTDSKNEMKKGFFKKIWYSIDKIEKYSELSAEGFGQAIKYLVILLIVLSAFASGVVVYRTRNQINDVAEYIKNEAPEFVYNDSGLSVEANEQPIITENENIGKIIIDTNTEDEQTINKYINDESGNVIVILKNELILKEQGIQGAVKYNYEELLKEMNITEFNKQSLVEYLTSSNMMSLYFNLFLVLIMSAFMMQLINTLFYVIIISIFGYLTTIILRLKIRYVAVFNMAIYSLTLPILLNILYVIVNGIFNYTINYFEVMYILVASIYMIAAIFILKSEFNKKQGEIQKIIEVEKQVKEEMQEEQKEEKKKEEKKENKDTNKDDEQENDAQGQDGEAPEGSNA